MGFVVILVAAGLIGTWLLRPAGIRADWEGMAYRLLLGYAVLAALIMAAGSVALTPIFHALLVFDAVGLAYELRVAKRIIKSPVPYERRQDGLRPLKNLSGYERLCATAVAAALAMALVSCLAPPTSWDAAVAHLALPADYFRDGRIHLMEGNAYSAYPHLMHSLYTAAYLISGATGAMLVNWSIAALGCMGMVAIGARLANRTAGWTAAAILATAPVFIDQAGTASIDLAFSIFMLAAFAAFFTWHAGNRTVFIVLAGLFAGAACGVRHTGYLTAVLLFLFVIIAWRKQGLRAPALFALSVLGAAAPWLLRSYILTANPFYPFLGDYFASTGPADQPIDAIGAHESLRGISFTNWLLFPWQLVMRPYDYDGFQVSPGPWALLLGAPGFLLAGKRGKQLGLFSIAGGTCLFFFRQYARYYLPFFLPMMVLAGVGAVRLKGLRYLIAPLLIFSFAYGLAYEAAAIHFKLPVAFWLESREDYLTRRVERYPAFQWINENLPKDAGILTIDQRTYYIKPRTHQNWDALAPLRGQPVVRHIEWMEERGIRYFLYPRAFVEESPGFREAGFQRMFERWRNDPRFLLIKRFDLPRPGGQGLERVELYEIQPR